jgi:phenylalanyl-tRNA synthetase beta chain
LDNVDIPTAITISPAVESNYKADAQKEKVAGLLVGMGFSEILTNSITNSKYATEEELATTVKLMNNLSSELDVLRPNMLYTALEVIAFNINRKAGHLKFFEWGKTYSTEAVGTYREQNHFCLYITGQLTENNWKSKATPSDIFYLKGVAEAVLRLVGLSNTAFETSHNTQLKPSLSAFINGEKLVELGQVATQVTTTFDVKQPVFFADFNWDAILKYAGNQKISYKEIARYPAVERDLAIVVPQEMKYHEISSQLRKLHLDKLQDIKLFDVFESEKLGVGKKSMAINFTFLDEEKTLTDKEIDSWMNRIMTTLEKELGAEVRR